LKNKHTKVNYPVSYTLTHSQSYKRCKITSKIQTNSNNQKIQKSQ